MKLGWPESRIPLAEITVYLATSQKSNSAYLGISAALTKVKETGNLPVPLHLRNAPTSLMKELGWGEGYKYAHDYEGNFVEQQFLPETIKNSRFWQPQQNQQEEKIKNACESCGKNSTDKPLISTSPYIMVSYKAVISGS